MPDQLPELPRYQCHKQVRAAKILDIEPGRADGRGPGATLVLETGARVSVSMEWEAKHSPREGGYYVAYDDGYSSYSPAQAFETGYTRILEVETQPSQFDS